MDDFTALDINLDGDGAWRDLADKEFSGGKLSHVAVLPDGTTRGNPSISLRGKLDDGSEVVLETTLTLFLAAARAIATRYGG